MFDRNDRVTSLLTAYGVLMLLPCIGMFAESSWAAAPGSGAIDGALEEIVVTATKRAESMQTIPVAITAMSTEALDRMGVSDVKGLSGMAPNLNIATASQDSSGVRVTLRGIGSGTLDGGSDPGVAVHIDGVYVGRNSALISDLVDVERVEVLRGPQGTLYGRNATGGAINIITTRPGTEAGVTADVTIGSYNERRFRASADIPLTGNLLSRVSVFSDSHDGYMKNLFPGGRNPDDKDAHGGRLQLQLTDARGDVFLLRGFAEKIGGVGPGVRRLGSDLPTPDHWPGVVFVGLLPGLPLPPGGLLADAYRFPASGTPVAPPPTDLLQVRENAPQYLDQRMRGADLTATVKFADSIVLKSITALQSNKSDILLDSDGSELEIETIRRQQDARQFSQEFNVSSLNLGRWNWLLGAFYYHEKIDEVLTVAQPKGVLSATAPIPPGLAVGGDGYRQSQTGQPESTSTALFGQVTYNLTDAIGLTAGYRYTWDDKKQTRYGGSFRDLTNGWYSNGTQFPDPLQRTETSYSDWGAHLALDYKLTPDHMLYVTWGRGYKAGGIDFNGANGTNGKQVPYRPEHVSAFEAGSKNEFFDHKLRINLAAFYEDYKDLQTFELTLTGPFTYNATSSKIKGYEVEFDWLPLQNLRLDGFYGYLDARYGKFLLTIPFPQDLTGNFLNYSPKHTGRFGAEYTLPLAGEKSLSMRGDYLFKSEYFMDQGNTPFDRQGGFGLFNAMLRLSFGKYHFDVYGRNLGDKRYIVSQLIGPPFACGCRNINVGDPRTYGVEFGAKF